MLNRFAPLVPLALVTLLFGCAAHSPVSQQEPQHQVSNSVTAQSSSVLFQEELATNKELADFAGGKSYQLPVLADSILERGMSLIGTRYRFGGTSEAGFDCSGFIGYLFREEAGMNLPRSTREMINVDAPLVARSALKPGDLLFFATNGRRGRVSHAGSTWVTTSSSTPAAAKAVVSGSIAWATATGARPSSKPSVHSQWHRLQRLSSLRANKRTVYKANLKSYLKFAA
jgi:hypothetical protein